MSGPDSITKTVTKTVKTFRAAMQVGVRGASRPRSHRRITAAVRTGPPPGRLPSVSRRSRTRDCMSSSTRHAIATGGGPCALVTNGAFGRHFHGNAHSHSPPRLGIAALALPERPPDQKTAQTHRLRMPGGVQYACRRAASVAICMGYCPAFLACSYVAYC